MHTLYTSLHMKYHLQSENDLIERNMGRIQRVYSKRSGLIKSYRQRNRTAEVFVYVVSISQLVESHMHTGICLLVI